MVTLLLRLLRLLPFLCGAHRHVALENLALRHQLAVYKKRVPRPKVRRSDRLFWVVLSQKRRRCHRRTVWGDTMTRACLQPAHTLCLDHVLVLRESHLRRILARSFSYYHRARTHLGLDLHPDRDEEHRHQEIGNRLDLLLDVLTPLRRRKHEPRREGADDGGQADQVCGGG